MLRKERNIVSLLYCMCCFATVSIVPIPLTTLVVIPGKISPHA